MAENRRFCENCGTEIGQATNFCPNCGAAQAPAAGTPTDPSSPEARRIPTPYAPGIPPLPEQPRGRGWAGTILKLGVIEVLLFVLLVACAAMLSGGGGSGSKQASGRTFTSEDYAELATDPGSFRGASVDVSGRVFRNPEVKGGETAFQMFADPENSEWNTIVRAEDAPTDLGNGDTVRVKGTVKGARQGENAFGATVKAVEVDADSVEVTKSKTKSGL